MVLFIYLFFETVWVYLLPKVIGQHPVRMNGAELMNRGFQAACEYEQK